MTYTPNRAVHPRPASRIVHTLLLGCVVVAVALLAPASQTFAADAQLPKDVRGAPQPDPKPIIDQINKCVELLKSDNPADQAKGRDMIIAETGPVGVNPPSPGFLYVYARELNKTLKDVAKLPNFRVRLNAAVAAARVAEKANNKELADVIVLFLNDSNEAVALWGMKGAKFVLKEALAQGGPAVIPTMITTALKFPSTAASAYDSLKVNDPGLTPQAVSGLIKGTQDLLAARVALYQKGVPPEPAAELVATSTLPDWWKQHLPNQKPITIQLLVNLGSLAGPLVAQAPAGEVQEQLKNVVPKAASAIVAISINEGKDLQGALKPVTNISLRSPAAQFGVVSAMIFTETKKVFTSVVPPGGIPGGATTAPASATSTATGVAGTGK